MRQLTSIVNMNAAWVKLMAMAEEHPNSCRTVAVAFNDMLDELADRDFFGTEGQLDPRGDNRE
jgi:hypothetical protein